MSPLKQQPVYFEIFWTFFQLGCYSFGGPSAHLVFFHQRFVQQLKWLDDPHYAQYLALAQLLPGPTSSQVGIAIGYSKGGYWGACCAWLGFTLPSAVLMTAAAVFGLHYVDQISAQVFHILHLIVLAVVFWAFWQMMRSFCQQTWQYVVMLAATVFLYLSPLPAAHIILILSAGIVGLVLGRMGWIKPSSQPIMTSSQPVRTAKTKKTTAIWLLFFILPFILFPTLYFLNQDYAWHILFSLYETASLVFGGGHIILPLMYQDFVLTEMLTKEQFDLGYSLTQLMPGPLFSFASYVGALLPITPFVSLNALIATIIIFLPSFFLMFAALPYWSIWIHQPRVAQMVSSINAAVVGLLLCLIIDVTQTAIKQFQDVIFVGMVILLLRSRLPIWCTLVGSFFAYYAVIHYLSLT